MALRTRVTADALPEQFGEPAAAALNCEGTLLALLFVRAGGAPGEHDRRVVVQNLEGDATMTLKLGAHECEPVGLHWATDEPRLLAVQVRRGRE